MEAGDNLTNDGTPREALLPKGPASSNNNNQDFITHISDGTQPLSNDANVDLVVGTNHSHVSAPTSSKALLGLCTLALVLVGLGLVLFVSFLPLWMVVILKNTALMRHALWRKSLVLALFLSLVHLLALWFSSFYLYLMRTAWILPIRRLLFPLVPMIARLEAIRERETTQYYLVPSSPSSTTSSTQLAPHFRKSVRRHYKRMEKIYQRSQMNHLCVRADTHLCLKDVIPVIWEQQQRSTDSVTPLTDFIKRALVVTVVPDGILDLYYTATTTSGGGGELVAAQFSILQGTVWHWFMYFCRSDHAQAGIWWHGALLAIQRGHVLNNSIQDEDEGSSSSSSSSSNNNSYWVNAQVHQKDSKLHAGYSAAHHTQSNILSQVYPQGWIMTRRIPESVLRVRLWDHQGGSQQSWATTSYGGNS
jgi:hypothetical protein